MIVWKILEVKAFMAQLLLKDTFDSCLLSDAEIAVATTFRINGRVNREWFDDKDEAADCEGGFSGWKKIKPFVFQLVKGKKTPLSMKIVFRLSGEMTGRFLAQSGTGYQPTDVDGLFWNLHYDRNGLHLTAGVSMRIFVMDKSLELAFESWTRSFLKEAEIVFEEA